MQDAISRSAINITENKSFIKIAYQDSSCKYLRQHNLKTYKTIALTLCNYEILLNQCKRKVTLVLGVYTNTQTVNILGIITGYNVRKWLLDMGAIFWEGITNSNY